MPFVTLPLFVGGASFIHRSPCHTCGCLKLAFARPTPAQAAGEGHLRARLHVLKKGGAERHDSGVGGTGPRVDQPQEVGKMTLGPEEQPQALGLR